MPKLADGLPRSFGPTSDFDKRLHEQFPVGSNESQLTAELKREKFLFRDGGDTGTAYRFAAIYDRHDFPCREVWTVLWSAESGRITAIAGGTAVTCVYRRVVCAKPPPNYSGGVFRKSSFLR